MKKFMRSLNVKENNITVLQDELLKKLRKQFNVRMQLKLGHLKKIHILKTVSREIASIKYFLSKNRRNICK